MAGRASKWSGEVCYTICYPMQALNVLVGVYMIVLRLLHESYLTSV